MVIKWWGLGADSSLLRECQSSIDREDIDAAAGAPILKGNSDHFTDHEARHF